jgi:hypothetical protein
VIFARVGSSFSQEEMEVIKKATEKATAKLIKADLKFMFRIIIVNLYSYISKYT